MVEIVRASCLEIPEFVITAKRKDKFSDSQKREIFQQWPYNMVEAEGVNKKIKTIHAAIWPEVIKHLPNRRKDKTKILSQQKGYAERLTKALVEMSHRAGCTAVDRNKDIIKE